MPSLTGQLFPLAQFFLPLRRPFLVHYHSTSPPDGHAVALVPHPSDPSLCFVSAHVQPTLLPQAIDHICRPPKAYLQQQNDCFRTEYGELESDCDGHIPWASEALGCLPEAEKGEFRLDLEEPERYIPWSSVNPCPVKGSLKHESLKFPFYFKGPKPFEVTVKAGEALYLFLFAVKYAYFNFLQSLPCRSINAPATPESECEQELGPHASSNQLNSRFSDDESATTNVKIDKDRYNVYLLTFRSQRFCLRLFLLRQRMQENRNDCDAASGRPQ
ncbi:Phospholipase-like protein isoform 2 [Hibiscus syriacus]|uniref:Phospholipase-like protein isoform 2 n=1 Tax=Hibiscus syriacus TaxID=106335 RepID=A0A6A3ANJ4_HIBSY|nr:Phospholipase-like protein isoform 2 [Hibiscus syriacus]